MNNSSRWSHSCPISWGAFKFYLLVKCHRCLHVWSACILWTPLKREPTRVTGAGPYTDAHKTVPDETITITIKWDENYEINKNFPQEGSTNEMIFFTYSRKWKGDGKSPQAKPLTFQFIITLLSAQIHVRELFKASVPDYEGGGFKKNWE